MCAQSEDQPRKLIDRRRLVEMKMQEDEALFKNIMRAIEPCFQLVASKPEPEKKEDSTDLKKRSKIQPQTRGKPYPSPMELKKDAHPIRASPKSPETDPTVRVSVIKHAPASVSPPVVQSIFPEPINRVPPKDNRLLQLYAAGLIQETLPWPGRCLNQTVGGTDFHKTVSF